MQFKLTLKESKQLKVWMEKQDAKVKEATREDRPIYGAVGGGYTYHLTPNNIGCVVIVTNNVTKETIDVTDYDSW